MVGGAFDHGAPPISIGESLNTPAEPRVESAGPARHILAASLGHGVAMARVLTLSLIIFLLGLVPASAQQDISNLLNRMSRLEREIADLQRSVFTSQPPGTSQAITDQVAPSVPQGSADSALALVGVRLQQMEAELRSITGQVEELAFSMQQLSDRMDKVQIDTDIRFQELSRSMRAPGSESVPTTAPGAPPPNVEPQATAGSLVTGAPPGTLGTLTGSDLAALSATAPETSELPPPDANAAGAADSDPTASASASAVGQTPPAPAAPEGSAPSAAPAAVTAPAPAVTPAPPPAPSAANLAAVAPPPEPILPEGSIEDRYKAAFDHLVKHDHDRAEIAFTAFLAAHPDDPLAGNAQYWLGETFYARDRHEEAAVAFLEGYQRYPESPKAADNLLKLGMSLARIGKTQEACATFARLGQEFPNAPTNIRRRLTNEVKTLGCSA